jgi:hypothetical protein
MAAPTAVSIAHAEAGSLDGGEAERSEFKRPQPGGRQPERYGFSSSSRGGAFRLEALQVTLGDANRSLAFAKQFWACMEIKD